MAAMGPAPAANGSLGAYLAVDAGPLNPCPGHSFSILPVFESQCTRHRVLQRSSPAMVGKEGSMKPG